MTDTTVVAHLRAQAAEQRHRYAHPVVGMDCIAGQARAEFCEALAQELDGLDEPQALQRLKARRDGMALLSDTSAAIVFSIAEKQWFEGVVDALSREERGWIEVQSTGFDGERMLNLPSYRRMLGINHCVAHIARERTETDAAWAARRAQWLAHYHPAVPVVHGRSRWSPDPGKHEVSLGTVSSFAAQEHTVEADLVAMHGIRRLDGSRFEIVEVFMAPKTPALATVRQTAGAAVPPGLVHMGRYHVQVLPAAA